MGSEIGENILPGGENFWLDLHVYMVFHEHVILTATKFRVLEGGGFHYEVHTYNIGRVLHNSASP